MFDFMKPKKGLPSVELNKVAHITNSKLIDIPRLNAGGCGLVAEHLYRLLVKMGYKPEIIVLVRSYIYNDMETYIMGINAKRNIKDIKKAIFYNAPAFSHIIIKVNSFYMDGNGIYDSAKEVTDFEGEDALYGVDYDMLCAMNRSPIWNNTFNMSNNNRGKAKLTTKFKHIEKELTK
jgi:hypothetical protein